MVPKKTYEQALVLSKHIDSFPASSARFKVFNDYYFLATDTLIQTGPDTDGHVNTDTDIHVNTDHGRHKQTR